MECKYIYLKSIKDEKEGQVTKLFLGHALGD